MGSPLPTEPLASDKTGLYTVEVHDGVKEEEPKPLYSDHRESRSLHVPTDYASGILPASSPDGFSEMSIDDRYSLQISRRGSGSRNLSNSATPAVGLKGKAIAFWTRNVGLGYVLFAQIFGTLMNVTARYVGRDVLRRILHPVRLSPKHD